MAAKDIPPLPEHWPKERDHRDDEWGVTWCRECGYMLVKDRDPAWAQAKPCRIVRIVFK